MLVLELSLTYTNFLVYRVGSLLPFTGVQGVSVRVILDIYKLLDV